MTIKMILSVDQSGAVGWSDGRLAHSNLRDDMTRFKELTTGHTVVMGFRTFVSLNRPFGLPNRKNIVLTRRPYSEVRSFIDPAVDVISSLDYVKRLDDSTVADSTTKTAPIIWIIGGASVYEEALEKNLVDEIYLTSVHCNSDANVRMTTDLISWKCFVLAERRRGIDWEVNPLSHQWDGDTETTYIHFRKIS